jgi:Ca-activated chloride channel family protein
MMLSQRYFPHIAFAAILLAVPLFLMAGVTGRIAGTVTDDSSGQPIPGVLVRLAGTGLQAVTDANGTYMISHVSSGTYRLVAEAAGYDTASVETVVVTADSKVIVDIALVAVSGNTGQIILESKTEEGLKDLRLQLPAARQEADMAKAFVGGVCAPTEQSSFPPAHGGTAIVNGDPFDAMFFKNYGVNPFVDTEDDHFSTFAVDVDDASYIMTRSYLERGSLPPEEAVRVEEFINHFDYGYDAPYSEPFAVYLEGGPSRFGQNCALMRIGIKGLKIAPEHRKPANLVFVIDVSGSMDREDRLSLVKKALRYLVDQLREGDRVGIVVYGSRGEELLQPMPISQREVILNAIEWLRPSGSTNAEEGLHLAYRMADRVFEAGKINRVILCSDGVANVGETNADNLLTFIKQYADKGITLSTIGFGMGNFNDILMEKLGDKGNGHYAYVDDIAEARRIFVDNLTGALQVIARDVKVQVDFNPDVVRSYRLLGYENRDVADDKFRDDKEDGGEVGSGLAVTALYEIKFHTKDRSGLVGKVFIRYKDPDADEVTEFSRTIDKDRFGRTFEDGSPQFRLAASAAEFAEILRKSYWAKESSLAEVLAVAKSAYDDLPSPEVLELMHLISKAADLQDGRAEK